MWTHRIAAMVIVLVSSLVIPQANGTVNPHNGENLSAEAQDAFNEECGRDGSKCDGEEKEEIFEEDAETPVTITISDPFGILSISWIDEY